MHIKEFPKLSESTIRGCITKYRSQIKYNPLNSDITITEKRGRSLFLPNELDFKLWSFLTHLRNSGGNINRHVVYGVPIGVIQSNLDKYGKYLHFHVELWQLSVSPKIKPCSVDRDENTIFEWDRNFSKKSEHTGRAYH